MNHFLNNSSTNRMETSKYLCSQLSDNSKQKIHFRLSHIKNNSCFTLPVYSGLWNPMASE